MCNGNGSLAQDSQVRAGHSVQLVSVYFQGAVFATNDVDVETTSAIDGADRRQHRQARTIRDDVLSDDLDGACQDAEQSDRRRPAARAHQLQRLGALISGT